MNEHRHIITGVTRRHTGDSRTDGIGAARLPFPAVSFHIDLPAIEHSEVTSDTDSLSGLFLTDYCKALSGTLFNDDFHTQMIFNSLRAWSGFSSTPSDYLQKNRASILENKYPVVCSTRACLLSFAKSSLILQMYTEISE